MIVRRDNGKVVEFEEVRYGMLMMVLCDREVRFIYWQGLFKTCLIALKKKKGFI